MRPRLAAASRLTTLALAASRPPPSAPSPRPPRRPRRPGRCGRAASGRATATDGCLESRPEPGTTEPVEICYTLFRPAGASRDHRVPLIMHSHGWGGSRTTDPARLPAGGCARATACSPSTSAASASPAATPTSRTPASRAATTVRLIRPRRRLPLGAAGRPGRPAAGRDRRQLRRRLPVPRRLQDDPAPRDPRLRRARAGDHLARPQREPRPAGRGAHRVGVALSAAARPTDALPPKVYKALVEGSATGDWPDGSRPGSVDMPRFFRRNGPKVARRPRPPPRHPGAHGPGPHRHPLQPPAGARQLAHGAHPRRPPGEHLRRLQRRPRAPRRPARGRRGQLRPVQRAARRGRLRHARPRGSWTSSSRAATATCAATAGSTSPPATAAARPSAPSAPTPRARSARSRSPRRCRRPDRVPGRRRGRSGSPGRRTSPGG